MNVREKGWKKQLRISEGRTGTQGPTAWVAEQAGTSHPEWEGLRK